MRPVLMTLLVVLSLLASAYDVVRATDPGPLQDFCVAINGTDHAAVFVNGMFCKDPKLVTADDFIFQGLSRAKNTSNPQNSKGQTWFDNH
ncbi:hypothetical protein MLD38_001928 [Melastoma candidum]|uniref:Uncharacterized protein n=1 Tax=Melastoma candidum TaxID=119954 RepID=A0ACB9SE49_9MYRT|nr:hypothetical protein MLD38_001928 [Melastoma candidum]